MFFCHLLSQMTGVVFFVICIANDWCFCHLLVQMTRIFCHLLAQMTWICALGLFVSVTKMLAIMMLLCVPNKASS